MRKTKNITTAYPSIPKNMNGVGAGSGCGGFGHDSEQSMHTQAGVFSWRREIASM